MKRNSIPDIKLENCCKLAEVEFAEKHTAVAYSPKKGWHHVPYLDRWYCEKCGKELVVYRETWIYEAGAWISKITGEVKV